MPFLDLAKLDIRDIMPGFHGKLIHTDQVSVVHWEIDAGALLPDHAHPQEQISIMLAGEFEFTIGGETRVVGPGEVAVIPGNTRHSGRAVTAVRVIELFSPPRDDYR
jgi:quercetin dioxygenase-like cupin family protein